jgi:hypothetical protein
VRKSENFHIIHCPISKFQILSMYWQVQVYSSNLDPEFQYATNSGPLHLLTTLLGKFFP